jgi:hypothetical protein
MHRRLDMRESLGQPLPVATAITHRGDQLSIFHASGTY